MMRRMRRRSDIVGLAFAALALQLVSAFGHVHLAFAQAQNLPVECRTFYPAPSERACPPSHKHDPKCAVCLAITLAGNGVVHEPPSVPVPERLATSAPVPQTRGLVTGQRAAAFQARAPPSA